MQGLKIGWEYIKWVMVGWRMRRKNIMKIIIIFFFFWHMA